MTAKIIKGDKVIVIAGKDKGKTGEVLSVLNNRKKVTVVGINIAKRHTKPNQNKNTEGGIIPKEMPIDISNVSHIDPETNKATKIGIKLDKDGKIVREFAYYDNVAINDAKKAIEAKSNPPIHFIEMWTATDAWKKLSQKERGEYMAGLAGPIQGLMEQGVEIIRWGANEGAPDRRAD